MPAFTSLSKKFHGSTSDVNSAALGRDRGDGSTEAREILLQFAFFERSEKLICHIILDSDFNEGGSKLNFQVD